MWYNTSATKVMGTAYPILQGPFGGKLSTVQLVAAVSNNGGLGGYGAYTLTPDEIVRLDADLRRATDKPYNINLWVSNTDMPLQGVTAAAYATAAAALKPFFDELNLDLPAPPSAFMPRFEDQAQVILDVCPPVFSFVFGIPSADILEQCRRKGIVTAGGATTLDEALSLEAAGVDLIVASGFEGGGHRPSFLAPSEASLTGTFVLIQQVREKVRTPVIAAGGIATGKGIAAALTLGADGVQVGTAFLACEESGAPAMHRELLFSEAGKYTVLTRSFTGRLARGLANHIAPRWTNGAATLPFPLQSRLVGALRQAAIDQGKWDLITLWGGQVAPLLTHTRAEALMTALIKDTTKIFNHE
ncbi:NAD(P)H-dependent flavin oxidoreductase [Dinghuibacter silviterrae]|uniref:Propionate 3-nitronate monooxygenase n=1 Tax=Dinghuibacter silviterrae TaxID=1539049 RepID=A0A4R8DF79_9BACT|nr:nitronate monooxygenase [Dinghuibacter silviterrae]TDW96231.1 nitronate monooxygenase [Dinghuibacter silviterrae]